MTIARSVVVAVADDDLVGPPAAPLGIVELGQIEVADVPRGFTRHWEVQHLIEVAVEEPSVPANRNP